MAITVPPRSKEEEIRRLREAQPKITEQVDGRVNPADGRPGKDVKFFEGQLRKAETTGNKERIEAAQIALRYYLLISAKKFAPPKPAQKAIEAVPIAKEEPPQAAPQEINIPAPVVKEEPTRPAPQEINIPAPVIKPPPQHKFETYSPQPPEPQSGISIPPPSIKLVQAEPVVWQITDACGESVPHLGDPQEANQDRLLVVPGLFVIADGAGGEANPTHGAESVIKAFVTGEFNLHAMDIRKELENAVRRAHEMALIPPKIELKPGYSWLDQEIAEERANKGGMSTLLAAAIRGNMAHIVNVGDSIGYLVREDYIVQVTVDDSVAGSNTGVTQLVGHSIGDIHYKKVELRPGDRLILTSDGISDNLKDEEILALARQSDDPREIAVALISAAKEARKKDDDATAIVYIYPG